MAIRSSLVNAKTAQKLRELDHVKHGFVCEGRDHIEFVRIGLAILGYQNSQRFGDSPRLLLPLPGLVKKHMEELLRNELDLQKTFKQIFEQQTNS